MARIRPIDHDTGSAIATTAWSAGKYGIAGAIVAGLVGAAVVGGIAALGVAAIGAALGAAGIIGGTAATATSAAVAATAGSGALAAMGSGVGALAIGIASFLGFGGALSTVGGVATVTAGGLLGLFKGGRRVGLERQAYQDKAGHAAPHQNRLAHVAEASMQHGYMQGVQDGQQMVVAKLRELQMASLNQQMETDKVACQAQTNVVCEAKGPHVQAEIKRREAAATTGQHIG